MLNEIGSFTSSTGYFVDLVQKHVGARISRCVIQIESDELMMLFQKAFGSFTFG